MWGFSNIASYIFNPFYTIIIGALIFIFLTNGSNRSNSTTS